MKKRTHIDLSISKGLKKYFDDDLYYPLILNSATDDIWDNLVPSYTKDHEMRLKVHAVLMSIDLNDWNVYGN